MSDPFRLFAGASDGKQETLRAVWPELYESLAGLGEPDVPRVIRCAVYATHEIGTVRPATGRTTENGHPACAECIAVVCSTTNGYPLERVTRTS